ncbi:MAG: hypothetical protein E4G93_05485 [Dehalococcoidia bacterium]|nr:MAG: hypothetical protein E4G93_05485 [Dehalococcoidia bacterium]
MSNRRRLAHILGVLMVAGLLAGCSDGSLPPAPSGAVPQESTSPAGAAEQEVAPPAGAVEQETVPSVSATEEENDLPVNAVEEESIPPVGDSEPITGPSEERYALRTGSGVDVVYFETSAPCSCMAEVGDAIEYAVLTYFQEELQSGELRYFVMVSNAPDNMDYVAAFNSQPFDLFIVDYVDGKGTAVPSAEIWTLQGDDAAVVESVHQSVLSALEGHR